MSYLAIYRKFRPTSFDKMIGQEHVVTTLINQIKGDRIGHAYLFCGARGTGKTTAAKIFARAINCLEPINGSPCGRCEACQKLENPSNLDILEIDAASNNKVENVREIRDNVQYPPVAGRFKVYIIDEVHMLTTEAFNALLKTLEEPPKHAVFILATTEPHKLPATILSRCMRFDFHLVADKVIQELIEGIYKEVGKDYEKEAVALIAKAGEGSVRDALSIADLCLSSGDGKLTYNTVIALLGASDSRKTAELLRAVLTSKVGDLLSITGELTSLGNSVGVLVKDVCAMVRDIMVVKTCKGAKEILLLPDDEYKTLKELSALADSHRFLRILEIFTAVENDLKYSTHPKIIFETAAVKSALPQEDYNQDALISRISALEKRIKELEEGGATVVKEVVREVVREVPSKERTEIEKPKEIKKEKVEPLKEGVKTEKNLEKTVEKTAEKIDEVIRSVEKVVKKAVEVEEAEEKRLAGFDYISEEELRSIEDSIPPADDQIGLDIPFGVPLEKSVNKPIIEEKPVEKPRETKAFEKTEVKAETVQKPKDQVADSRLWGLVIRKLRAEQHIMLWIASQELEARVENGYLTILADGDSEYGLLSKPESVKIIQDITSTFAPYTVKVVRVGKTDEVDETEKAVKEITEAFDGKITVKD